MAFIVVSETVIDEVLHCRQFCLIVLFCYFEQTQPGSHNLARIKVLAVADTLTYERTLLVRNINVLAGHDGANTAMSI